jgi:hypothetical protein
MNGIGNRSSYIMREWSAIRDDFQTSALLSYYHYQQAQLELNQMGF